MAKQLFKGFKQVSGVTSTSSLENGYIYFVREDGTKEHGYLYFNGKKYGTTKEVADELTGLTSAINAEVSARTEAILGVQGQLSDAVSSLTEDDVVDVRYDSTAKTIYMEFKDGTTSTGFDASDFIVDGMLSSVTYDASAHTMTFIWNTDAGGKEITIDLDDVIAPYKGDNETIELGADNTFSAIMDRLNGVASYAALTGVQSRIDGLDATLSASSHGVTVEITQTDGLLSNLTVTAPEAAGMESSDDSIDITTSGNTTDFKLNRETSTDATVAAGHLEIALNASGEAYAVMYYDGNDTANN